MVKTVNLLGFPGGQVRSLGHEDPLEEGIATHSSILREFHGHRNMAGYSPWGCRESNMTEMTNALPLTHVI